MTKAKINAAFRALRKQGVVARQEIRSASVLEDEICNLSEEKRGAILGMAYTYADCAGDSFLTVLYNGAPCCPNSKEMRQVGQMVRQAFLDQGLAVKWNGDPSKVVLVAPTGLKILYPYDRGFPHILVSGLERTPISSMAARLLESLGIPAGNDPFEPAEVQISERDLEGVKLSKKARRMLLEK